MKSRAEFNTFYTTTLVPKLQQLEVARKKIARKIYLFFIGAGSVAAIWILFLNRWGENGINALFIGILVCAGLVWFLNRGEFEKFVNRFKLEIIKNLVKFFDESLEYFPNTGVSNTEYHQSELFLTGVDRYFADDLVVGKMDKTHVKFSEIHTEYKVETINSKGETETSWNTIFRGIFFIADFNKNFKGRTLVLPDTAEKLFGSFIGTMFQKMDISRDPLVKLEDPEFEKLFCVHSSDQVEARYILSPKLMQHIVALQKKSGKTIYLSFIDAKVFIGISIAKPLFEPSIFSSLLNFRLIEEFFEYLYLSISIVEELDLNTRIWTKE